VRCALAGLFCAIGMSLSVACGSSPSGEDSALPENDSAGPTTGPDPAPVAFRASGTISVRTGTANDTDVNDLRAPYIANDTFEAAQPLVSP